MHLCGLRMMLSPQAVRGDSYQALRTPLGAATPVHVSATIWPLMNVRLSKSFAQRLLFDRCDT